MQGLHIWQFLAGIAIFVYAMSLIESSIKHLAGRSFKKYLQKQSKNKFRILVSSTVITAILQSSSIAILMVLSFVGAGLINLGGALAAVLGSNLGTTLYNWIIVLIGFKFSFSVVSFPVLAIALAGLLIAGKHAKLQHLSHFLIGFALIFISLDWLKGSLDNTFINNFPGLENLHYLAFIPIGILITAIIQSSSATMAITLTGLYNNIIPFESAAAIVIGSELGTAVKFLIGSIGGVPDKRRVAWGNFIFNTITILLSAAFLPFLVHIIRNKIGITDTTIGLVIFQSGINLLSIILFFPFLGLLSKLLTRMIKGKMAEDLARFIRKHDTTLAGDAMELAEKETIHLLNEAIELNKEILGIHDNKADGLIDSIKKFASESSAFSSHYEKIKTLQGEILEYITEIPKSELTEVEVEHTGKLINITRHILRSSKNVKDIRHNLEEFDATPNDTLFATLTQIKSEEASFYNGFQKLLNDSKMVTAGTIDELLNGNRKQYDSFITTIIDLVKHNKIAEIESSNLINVCREIYSSNKGLILALADIKDLVAENS